MRRMIENITGNYTSSASVVDGTLILSLPDAISPIVWRMDLGSVRASAIEVRNNDDATFTLALKTPHGNVNDIAKYDRRGRAVTALMAVTRAMEHAHGQIRPVANDADTASRLLPVPAGPRRSVSGAKRGNKNWLGAVVALALVGILFLFMTNMGPQPMKPPVSGVNPASGSAAPAIQSGTPLSADDFLKGR